MIALVFLQKDQPCNRASTFEWSRLFSCLDVLSYQYYLKELRGLMREVQAASIANQKSWLWIRLVQSQRDKVALNLIDSNQRLQALLEAICYKVLSCSAKVSLNFEWACKGVCAEIVAEWIIITLYSQMPKEVWSKVSGIPVEEFELSTKCNRCSWLVKTVRGC